MFIFTVTTDCSIDKHYYFERMDVVKAWALQMKTISFKILGAKMNIECIKYLQKNSMKTIFERKLFYKTLPMEM